MAANPEFMGFKDPLEYYKSHPELHYLSRTQLKESDSRLYYRLLRTGKIDMAVPDLNFSPNFLSSEEIRKIVVSYLKYPGDYAQAAKFLHHGMTTIMGYWRMFHLPFKVELEVLGKKISNKETHIDDLAS